MPKGWSTRSRCHGVDPFDEYKSVAEMRRRMNRWLEATVVQVGSNMMRQQNMLPGENEISKT